MARKRKSTRSRFSWRHTRRRKSVQEVSSSTNYSSTITRQATSSQVISPFKASCKTSFKSPYKSPFKKSLNVMSPLEMKSPARKRMRSSGNQKLCKKSPFSCKSQIKSPIFRPRYIPNTRRFQNVGNKTSIRQLFALDENASYEDFTELSNSTLSASDYEEEELPTDVQNKHTPNQQAETDLDKDIQRIRTLLPNVMERLSKTGMHEVMVSFFELISLDEFPQDNIAFLLWGDVVKWFSMTSSTRMRYTKETKMFWKLGWRLFGKRFLNFMGGYKSHGELLSNVSNKGQFHPQTTEINFAVPDVSILRAFNPYDTTGTMPPGIFNDTICDLGKSMAQRSACLTFDGKKLKQGLTETSGDVDLLGHESGETLKEKKENLEVEIGIITEMESKIQTLDESTNGIDDDTRTDVKALLEDSLANVSKKFIQITKLKEKKCYCKKKLIERSGDMDWRKGRFAFAISSVTAFIHELEEFLLYAKTVLEKICRHLASLNNDQFVEGNRVQLQSTSKYFTINELVKHDDCSLNTRYIEQKSEEWFSLRKNAKVTGSTLYSATGCDGLGKLKDHFESVVCGVSKKEVSVTVQEAMKHGTDNEINAVGTIAAKVVPVVYPGLIFCEEGCAVVKDVSGETFMVVSPDGSLRRSTNLDSTEVAIEIKCPVREAHAYFPERYMLQCLAEMHVLNVKELLYVSWTADISTVFKVRRNDSLLQRALSICMDVYGTKQPRKPVKLTQQTKDLKHDIKIEADSVEFIGIFPSCIVTKETHNYCSDISNCRNICDLLEEICGIHRKCYEIQRERATEAVVFLIGDLDRSWKKDAVRCSPVGWFPKGYILDCSTMRKIAEDVHSQCTMSGIHVPCESFDGQWHTLVVRDANGEPLTVYQLQKDVWRAVEQRSKKDLLDELKGLNKEVIVLPTVNEPHCVIMTNGGNTLPVYRRYFRKKSVEQTIQIEDQQIATLSEIVPDEVQEMSDIGRDVLAVTLVTDPLEIEAFVHSTDIEKWSDELQDNESDEHNVNSCLEHETEPMKELENERPKDEIKLETTDMKCILALFKTTKDCNKNMQWNAVTPDELKDYFRSYKKMCTLRDIEIRVIVRYLKKTKRMTKVKESSSKLTKLDGIANFIGMQITDSSKRSRKVPIRQISSLKDLAAKVVSKYSKQELNIIVAEMMFPNKYTIWKEPVKHTTINGETQEWFYKPEYSSRREQLEVKCIDSTHLLTRARRKTCVGGIENVSNDPWVKVAREKNTLLTTIMVDEISDPMSVSMAKTHFSESVENEMRKNGDAKAADLVHDIRCWWESEDSPGIPSDIRLEKRQHLRKRLLNLVEFTRFPPPTQYVGGWPVQLWEALLASIDAKAYLYTMVHGGTYNVRAFSSLIGETFFSEVTLNDKRGHGTISALEFSQFLGYSTEQLQIRLDQDRHFAYCTSKRKVYETVDESYVCDSDGCNEFCRICSNARKTLPSDIILRNHPFDSAVRKRLAGRRKIDHIPSERNAVLRGSLGVRWEKARCDMSKMLTCKRMGIDEL